MKNKPNKEDLEYLIKQAGYDLNNPETFQIQSKEDLLRLQKLQSQMIAITLGKLKNFSANNRTDGGKMNKKIGGD